MHTNMNLNLNFFIGVIIGIVMLYILTEIRNHCFIQSDSKELLDEIITKLSRQAARWSTAAEQDENSMVAVLHANYGAGYLWALKDIATPEQIKSATGLVMADFEKEITTIQDKATMKMSRLCPAYAPRRTILTSIAGEGE